jgi:D-inositol-3-phosphate glycosyltransferase
LLNDVYMLKNYQSAWIPLKAHGIKLAAYTPLDGSIIDYNILKDAVFLDALVLYHDGAKQEMEKAIEKIEENEPTTSYEWPNLYTIYHGVDVSSFQPIDETHKGELKKKLFPVQNSEESIFILNANRFNERKNIEATIDAFALAIPHFIHPTYLVLHTPNIDPLKRQILEAYIYSSGCSEYVLFNPLGENYCDDTMLNQLYQACDIGVNTSFGEGWGLISFEHAACGGAQIVPDHTCPGEIWKDVAMTTPSTNEIKLPTNPFMMYGIDTETLSKQMIELANEKEKRTQVANACMDYANDQKFKWATIAKAWSEIL